MMTNKIIKEKKTTKKEFSDNLNLLLVNLELKLASWDDLDNNRRKR